MECIFTGRCRVLFSVGFLRPVVVLPSDTSTCSPFARLALRSFWNGKCLLACIAGLVLVLEWERFRGVVLVRGEDFNR